MNRGNRSGLQAVLRALAALAVAGVAHAVPTLAQTPNVAPAHAAQDPALAPSRFVRAKDGGAKLFNLPDKNSVVVLHAPANALLAVYGERVGYLNVEPASGLEVWIYGQYVQASEQPGFVEVTRNSVLMRPLPQSDEKSYPIEQRLQKGDRVRLIARADASKPIAEDWIKIYSPPGTRAWVQATDTTPIAAGEDGHGAWLAAVKDAHTSMKAVDLGSAESASAPRADGANAPHNDAKAETKSQPSNGAFDEAEKMFVAARASDKPDFEPVRAAYKKVLDQSQKGPTADLTRSRIDEIAIREEIQKIKADSEVLEVKRQEELEKANARLREVSIKQDPLWGRFQARGMLERDAKSPGVPRWYVRWGGKTVAEVVCGSGRYDLETFAGSEIGLIGITVRAAIAANGANEGSPVRIDATRIEVISPGAVKR